MSKIIVVVCIFMVCLISEGLIPRSLLREGVEKSCFHTPQLAAG